MLAKTKTIAAVEPIFADAKAAYSEAKVAWEGLQAESEALKVLAIWNEASEADRQSDRFSWARRKYAEYWGEKTPPSLWRLPTLAREIEDRISAAHPRWIEAQRAFERACVRETSRVAVSLQPRQKSAVKRMADAITELCNAMAAERQLHVELGKLAPNASSVFLPECSPRIGCVSSPTSEFFAWRRRIHEMKVLD